MSYLLNDRCPAFLLALAGLVLAGCSARLPAPDPSAARAALMDADRAFAAETAARGLDGWMAVYTPDAVRLAMGGTRAAGTVVQGTAAVRAYDADLFADPAFGLLWEPTDGGTFADGRHGFTTGRSAYVRRGVGRAAPDTLGTGTYVTLWRLSADGHWQVILDTGASDPAR